MPNWCQNQLTVTGATPEFRAWLKHGFSFQRMKAVSLPKTRHETADDSWRRSEACHAAWGTKWDVDDNAQRPIADELLETGSASFDTAWSPPLKTIAALSRKFPKVYFQLHYCELGMCFAGTARFHGGACHTESCQDHAGVMRMARDIFGYEEEDEEEPGE